MISCEFLEFLLALLAGASFVLLGFIVAGDAP